MIIEFAGLPGAGKSTQRDLLIDHLVATHASIATPRTPPPGLARGLLELPPRLRLHGRRLHALLAHRMLVSFACRVLLRSPRSTRDKLLAMKWLLLTLDDYMVVRSLTGDHVYVCDEGIAQRAFTLFAEPTSRPDPRAVRRYLAQAPRPDVLIHLQIHPALAVTRLNERAVGVATRLAGDPGTVEQRLALADTDVLALAREDFLSSGVEVGTFDAADVTTTIAAEVAAFVDGLRGLPRPDAGATIPSHPA